jgi:plasmid stability protein
MADIMVRGLSPELEASLQAYAARSGLSLSQAALELIQQGLDGESTESELSAGVPVGDYLAETLKEALHTKDEAEEFIRSHE